MTVLSFTSTPDEILEKLRGISEKAFREAVAALDALYQEYKKLDSSETKERIYYEPLVMTFGELCSKLKKERGGAFDDFYRIAYADIAEKIADGAVNYPSVSVELMDIVLNFADIKQPLVLLGFAPPYYPAVHSDMIPGCKGAGTAVFKRLEGLSTELFGQDLVPENFAMGISDLSYCAVNRPFDTDAYSDNTPIWGDLYSIDFEGIANLNVPSILYGPAYKNPHQWTERVNKKSLLEVVPAVTLRSIAEQWEG